MKHLIVFSLFLLKSVIGLSDQLPPCPRVIHWGVVYVNRVPGSGLKGVEIELNGISGYVSNGHGSFMYKSADCYGTLIKVQVKKQGYDIVNLMDFPNFILKGPLRGNEPQFTVIMSTLKDISYFREEYYRPILNKSSERLIAELSEAKEKLKGLQKDKERLELLLKRHNESTLQFQQILKQINRLNIQVISTSQDINQKEDIVQQKKSQNQQIIKAISNLTTTEIDSSYQAAFEQLKKGNYDKVQSILSSKQLDADLSLIQNADVALKQVNEIQEQRRKNWFNKVWLKASSFQSQNKADSAIYWYKSALSQDSSSFNKLFNFAGYLYKNKKYEDAIVWYNKSLKNVINTDNEKNKADVYNNLGLLYSPKNLERGIENFEKAIEIRGRLIPQNKPFFSFIWFQSLACLYSVLNRNKLHEKAVRIINSGNIADINELPQLWLSNQTKVGRSSEIAQAIGNLSFYNILTGGYGKAEELAQMALKLDPSKHWIEVNLAHSLLLQSRYEEARIIYKKALDKANLNSEANYIDILTDIQMFKAKGMSNEQISKIEDIVKANREE